MAELISVFAYFSPFASVTDFADVIELLPIQDDIFTTGEVVIVCLGFGEIKDISLEVKPVPELV